MGVGPAFYLRLGYEERALIRWGQAAWGLRDRFELNCECYDDPTRCEVCQGTGISPIPWCELEGKVCLI